MFILLNIIVNKYITSVNIREAALTNKKNQFIQMLCAFTASLCLLSMYIFPDYVKMSVSQSVNMCGTVLIPSLFPFITVTRICAELFFRTLNDGKKCRLPFVNVSNTGIIVLILGLISGFPNGAYLAGTAYKSGSITKAEAVRIMTYSNCISPSFCILVFGNEVMKNKLLGAIVFASVLCSNLFMFFITGTKHSEKECCQRKCDFTPTPITTIISDSLYVMLSICAYVTVFGCFSQLLVKIFTLMSDIPNEFMLFISPIFEISGGITKLEALPFFKRLIFGSLLISFGGISAVMQVHNVCMNFGLSFSGYVRCKIVSSVIAPAFALLLVLIIGDATYISDVFLKFFRISGKYFFALIVLVVVLKLIYMVLKRIFSRKNIKKAN